MAISDKYAASDLEFAGHKIAVECNALTGEAEAAIKNYEAKNDLGSAEVAAVVACVDKLYIDGEVVNLRANKPFPRIRDEEGTSLLEFLLGFVVDNEPWLAKKWARIFAKYVDTAKQERDPTKHRSAEKMAS